METRVITCIQCENDFDFTPGEQKYFAEKGFDDPKRCPVCRRHKSKSDGYAIRKKSKKPQHHWEKYEFETE